MNDSINNVIDTATQVANNVADSLNQAADTAITGSKAASEVAKNMVEQGANWITSAIDWVTNNGLAFCTSLIGAVVFMGVGFWIARIITRSIRKIMIKRNADAGLTSFAVSLTNIALKLLIIISVLGMVGIEMTSFIAVLGAAGLAVGMALQGTLSNFAGGVMILIFKPYRVGDYIEAQGISGTVKEISIFNTIITTPDNKTIIVPNSSLSSGITTNYSTQPMRRVDLTVGVAYGSDFNKVQKVLQDIFDSDKRILQDQKPFVGITLLNNSSVDIAIKVWTKSDNYWDVLFDLNEKIYTTFAKENIEIPFPQVNVHVDKK